MALNKDSKNQYRVLIWDENETSEGVSDAIFREFYGVHSVHVKIDGTAEVKIQLSNIESPSEASNDDWVDYSTVSTSDIVPINMIFRWLRVIRDTSTDPVTVALLSGSRSNT